MYFGKHAFQQVRSGTAGAKRGAIFNLGAENFSLIGGKWIISIRFRVAVERFYRIGQGYFAVEIKDLLEHVLCSSFMSKLFCFRTVHIKKHCWVVELIRDGEIPLYGQFTQCHSQTFRNEVFFHWRSKYLTTFLAIQLSVGCSF